MYLAFYDLKTKPFEMTTDPAFLWVGEKHQAILEAMRYTVFEDKGLLVLTGDAGTGKTILINALIRNLEDDVTYAKISNPGLDILEFFSFIAVAFQMPRIHYRSKGEFLIDFEDFLNKCNKQNKKVLLVIEEAQNLSFELLDEIRLLANMEFADEKLINIFLVGQTGLNKKLNDPRCRALQQHTKNRFRIRPLDFEETKEYIATRLKIAGAKKGKVIFSTGAIEAIHQYSEGYPRMINRLADNVLLLGYIREKRKITIDLVIQCHEDMDLKAALPPSSPILEDSDDIKTKKRGYGVHGVRQWKWASVLISALIILGVGVSWHFYRASKVSDETPFVIASKDEVLMAQKMAQEEEDLGSKKIIGQQSYDVGVKTVQEDAAPSLQEQPVSSPEGQTEEPAATPALIAEASEPEGFQDRTTAKSEPPVFIEPSTKKGATDQKQVEPKVKKEMVQPKSLKMATTKTTPEKESPSQKAIPKPVQTRKLTIAQVQKQASTPTKKPVAPKKSVVSAQSPPKALPPPAESKTPPQGFGYSLDEAVSADSKEESRLAMQPKEISESVAPKTDAPTEEKIGSDVDQKGAVTSPEVAELQASIRTDSEHEYLKDRLEAFLALYCQTYQDKELDKFAAFFTTDATEMGKPFDSLIPQYRRNFERLDALNYRIELQRHSIHETTGHIHIEGIFRAQARLAGDEDKWRYSFGDISMELVPVETFFKVRRLDYKIR